jgi:hypothetical protein
MDAAAKVAVGAAKVVAAAPDREVPGRVAHGRVDRDKEVGDRAKVGRVRAARAAVTHRRASRRVKPEICLILPSCHDPN